MIVALLVLLVALWFLGFISLPMFPISNFVLFTLFGVAITLYQVIIFLIILWLIDLLPGFFKYLAGVLLLLWVLSVFGVITIINFPHIIVLTIIFGLVYFLIAGP